MGKPSSGKEAAANTDKGKAGKPVSKEGKGKSKPWSAYRQGEAEDNYRHRREVRASKGLKRSSRSTVAKSRDRPGKAERRLALYNKGEEVDPTPSQFPILPNNFTQTSRPKGGKPRQKERRRVPLLSKERRGLVIPTTRNQKGQKSRPRLQPRDPPFALRKGQEQDCPLLSLPRKGSRRNSSKTMRRNLRNSWRFSLTPQWKSSR